MSELAFFLPRARIESRIITRSSSNKQPAAMDSGYGTQHGDAAAAAAAASAAAAPVVEGDSASLPPQQADFSGGAGAPPPPVNKEANRIFLRLPRGVERPDLEAYFGTFGEMTDVYVPLDAYTGRSRGVAYISFLAESAMAAVLAAPEHHVRGACGGARAACAGVHVRACVCARVRARACVCLSIFV